MYDVVILTDSRYEYPKKINWYINQVLSEDALLKKELENQGLKVIRKDWASKDFNWEKTRYAIFRSTWDYFDRFDEFFKWIEKTKNKTKFINSVEIINWNIDKRYLQDLVDQNINVAATNFIEKDTQISLIELLKKYNWSEAILKPAISGAARHTYRITKKNVKNIQKIFDKLIKNECMLFQEFLKNIIKQGEISLIMISGEYTHSVRKIAKKNDFRVQDDHGGIVKKHNATRQEIDFAKQVIKSCPYQPIYARVDIVYDNYNLPSLSELELIEPELWFRNYPKAANKLAKQISSLFT